MLCSTEVVNGETSYDGQELSTALKLGQFGAWKKVSGDPDVTKPVDTGIFAATEKVSDVNDPMTVLMDEPDMLIA